MAPKPVIVFLIKVIVLMAALMIGWHFGLGRAYHTMLAGFIDVTYPPIDPTGVVNGALVREGDFLLRLGMGQNFFTLNININDIAGSNTLVLIALFLATPVRGHWNELSAHLSLSLLALFLIHTATVITVSQEAFMSHPQIMESNPFSSWQVKLVPRYNVFYEELGMYLFALLLWFPYVMRRVREDADAAQSPDDMPKRKPTQWVGSRKR